MELECGDISKINNEELLRKMWQQSEDPNLKTDIRSQLYKLRESRLRDLYQGDIMADNSAAAFGKDPFVSSHGDALADQSFQSLKSKEIRDSLSPTEMKFQSMALNNPNTTGWNVQSSKEVSPDGRGFRAETLATTDGVESINGGTAEFKGRNEQRSSAHHQGDDKNFIKKAMESSNSHLQEKVVIGDENSGRTEMRTSSSKSTSSSQVIQSSTNFEYDDQPKYLMDSKGQHQQDLQQHHQHENQHLTEEQRIYQQQQLNRQERHTTEQVSTTRQNTEQKNITQDIQTQETHEQNKRYVDIDKASPEYQQHVQYLMQQPGEIISNTVEYPKPNVKMITTVKRLPDGTIVRNKRYETEELPPTAPTNRLTTTSAIQARRDSKQQPTRIDQVDSSSHIRASQDMVDNSNNSRFIHDSHTDDVETKFSSIKESSSKYTTETTSETVQEFDDHCSKEGSPSRPKPKSNDFSTHGFPSVRANKPTQEYPTERPHTAQPSQGYPSQAGPLGSVIPPHTDNNITERRVNTKDGEVIIVSSEKKSNFKTSTNSERIVETEHIIRDDQAYQHLADKRADDFTTNGFPSVREPLSHQSKMQNVPLDNVPSTTGIIKSKHSPYGDDEVEVVVKSSQKSHTAKHSTNTESIMEHETIRDDQHSGYNDNATYNYTVTTPGDQVSHGAFPGSPKKPSNTGNGDFPAAAMRRSSNDYSSMKTPTRPAAGLPSSHNQEQNSPRKSPNHDYSTQGFPSVRSPTRGTPTQGYTAEPPRATSNSKTQPRSPAPNKSKAPNTTVRETTERVIRKEKEVDSAHRAFAASLRSSSPLDQVRRDSYTTDSHSRHTPRSSVSSTKTFRRDMREGSHDSAPSETSRISTATVTRNTPPRNVGGRTVVTKIVTTKTGPVFNDTLNVNSPRATKSPSPGKTVTTTTTTTRTLTSKDAPKVTDNQPTRITTNNLATLFPINESPLTSITKIKFNDNHKQVHKKTKNSNNNSKKNMPVITDAIANATAEVKEIIEKPCLKKHYYKLGPSDQTKAPLNTTTSQPLESPHIKEKSRTDKQSSQAQSAPSSRSSTPANKSRKPPTSRMADDYDDDDDDDRISTTSSFSPSSTSFRAPQDDRQMPRQPDNNERRTVNRETTFEKTEIAPTQPRKPNYEQPNVEWVIVDDVDDYDDYTDDDNDSFVPEVVDAKLNLKMITKKLITQEKETPVVPQRKATVTTKQIPAIPSKSAFKPNDRTPQPIRTQKTPIGSKSPLQSPSKSQIKVVDNKPLTKGPKSGVPSSNAPLRKPLPKAATEETALKRTLKTSQVLKEKTTKLIETEKPKRKPQSPERKTKQQTPNKRQPNKGPKEDTIIVTEITHRRPSGRKTPRSHDKPNEIRTYGNDEAEPRAEEPHDIDDEINQPTPKQTASEHHETFPYNGRSQGTYSKPQEVSPGDNVKEPQQGSLEYKETAYCKKPDETSYEPQTGSPGFKKPLYIGSESQSPQDSDNIPKPKSTFRKPPSTSFQKLQSTFDERSPQYGKPSGSDDEPGQNTNNAASDYTQPESSGDKPITGKPVKQGPQNNVEEHLTITETSQKINHSKYVNSNVVSSGYRSPKDTHEPYQGSPQPKQTPRKVFEEEIVTEISEKIVPGNEVPKKRRPSPEIKPGQRTNEEPKQGKHRTFYNAKPVETGAEPITTKPDTDDEDCLTESESIVVTSQKAVAKHIQKFETNVSGNKTPKPQKETKTPVKENTGPKRILSPDRNQQYPEDHSGKRPQSPTKNVSPNGIQKHREQNTSIEPTDRRPKYPSKHVSSPQTSKKQNTNTSLDDESYTTSLKTTKIVKEKIIKEFSDNEYPEHKPKDKPLDTDKDKEAFTENFKRQRNGTQSPTKNVSPIRTQKNTGQKLPTNDLTFRKSLRSTETSTETRPKGQTTYSELTSDTEEEETITETSEFVINSTKRLVASEQLIQESEEPSYTNSFKPERDLKSRTKGVCAIEGQRKPIEIVPEYKFTEPIGERSPSPNKHVSPTRTQKKTPLEDDKTFTTSLRTTKIVAQKVDDKKSPKLEKDNKSPTRMVAEKRPQSPNKPTSPTRNQMQQVKEDKHFRNTLKFTETVKETTAKDFEHQDYPNEKIPFKNGDKRKTKPKDRQIYNDNPSDSDEVEKSPKISSKTCEITEKLSQQPEYSNAERIQNIPDYRLPETTAKYRKPYSDKLSDNEEHETSKVTRDHEVTQENLTTYSTGKRPQSPSKPDNAVDKCLVHEQLPLKIGKTATRSQHKPEEVEVYPDTRNTNKFVKESVTETIENKEFARKEKPKNMAKFEEPELVEPIEKRPNDMFVHTREFILNTSQNLIATEQKALETEMELYDTNNKVLVIRSPSPTCRKIPRLNTEAAFVPMKTSKQAPAEDSKPSRTLSPSPEINKHSTKSDETKPQDQTPDINQPREAVGKKEMGEPEDLVIANCGKSYVTERNIVAEKELKKLSTTWLKPKVPNPNEIEQEEKKPENPANKSFATTYDETETIECQTFPDNTEQLEPTESLQEPWQPHQVPKCSINVNEKFIETERQETPDGAFTSKPTEPLTPTSPTFKKKGAARSDTFEERCRKILGMDTYGDTNGTYKKQPATDIEEKETAVTRDVELRREMDLKNETVFQVKIEDCDEDGEPLSLRTNLHKQIYTTEQGGNEPLTENSKKSSITKGPAAKPNKAPSKGPREIFESAEDYTKNEPKYRAGDKNEFLHTVTATRTLNEYSNKNKSINETESDASEPEMEVKETQRAQVEITMKPTSSLHSHSPTQSASTSRSSSPTKRISAPKTASPTNDTSKRKPNKDSKKKSPQKLDGDSTTTIKDRLRSSTRKTKSPSKTDQVDGSESSPEHSPSRCTERRRSSNISVTTEIIIEHTDSDTTHKKEKSPPIDSRKKPQDSVFKEIIDSTVMPEKLIRRLPVTERKESAPVHRVTNKDNKDSKMSRSTSENLIKLKNTDPHSLAPKTPTKTTDHRRPNKCFATKSINLSATDRLVKSEDSENIIIDIQHAKSSREPSPDKIVPTPVPAHLYTGKPRYPDVVQEPEEEQPKRKPQIKNIPIFEEENNSYIGCHITEVNMERSHKTTYDSLDYDEQILNHPVVEAPSSLDSTRVNNTSDDESLLTVQEKVNKFKNLTSTIRNPKAMEPLQTQFVDNYSEPRKEEKSQRVEEEVEEDKEFEHIYSAVKLAPTAPQKSPQLVRTISKHISRQNEPDFKNQANQDYPLTSRNGGDMECLEENKKHTKEFKVSHQFTSETTAKTVEKYQQPEEYDDRDDHDDDELIPHTATHTNIIEERRKKDILSRPSIFDSRNKSSTTTMKTPQKCNNAAVKGTEKLRPDSKSRTKPTSAVINTLTAEQSLATATSNKPKQSPQCKNSDIDYELRGSNIETGVRNIISKQTIVNNKTTNSGGSTTNDLNKSTKSNKNREKHMPVHLTPAKNSDEDDLSADDEMIITKAESNDDIDVETQVVNVNLNKETNRQIPLDTWAITAHKKQPIVHSSTNSLPTDRQLKTKTKEHVVKLTDKNPLKSNPVTSTTSTTNIKAYETVEKADDIDEIVLEPSTKKTPSHPHTKATKMSTTTTDSVAARRILFESNNTGSPSNTPTKRTPLSSPMSGRRPSYMDHTKSSLEHTRRDSLEINKSHYARKPSHPEEELIGTDRNSTVKFDVPVGKRVTIPRSTSITEDINVEEIFELEALEKLLETVQSYEIRRRIRAQIRLIKKNQKNEMIKSSTETTTVAVKSSKVASEEPDTATINNRKHRVEEDKTLAKTTQSKEAASHISSTKKEYIFEEAYHPTTRRPAKPNRYPHEEDKVQARKPTRSPSPNKPVCSRNAEHERHHSPDHQQQQKAVVKEHSSRITKQRYYYKDEQEHEEVQETRHETSPTRKSASPNRKPHSSKSSPERRYASPDSNSSLKANERSRSPQTKASPSSRLTSSRSSDAKNLAATKRKSSANFEQQETVKSSTLKPQNKGIPTTKANSKPEDNTPPVWADRKNILKAPSSTATKKVSSSTSDSRSGYTKTIKATTTSSQKMTSNKSSFVDDDCITSSYGIGPTDENGLPLFGIRALKKKKPTVEPSETTEEVTGYVLEENYYSDNKTKPIVERKEFIYSTNPEELQKLKEQVEVTDNKKTLQNVDLKETRQAALITKTTPTLRSSPEDDFLDSATKYVRRGSVKEMSEKFIQKEAASTVTEKSSNYPKAGLILRTNSRKSSREMDNENEHFESYKTTRVQQHLSSTVLADSDDAEHEYEVEEVSSRHSGRFINESESECESIKTQREVKKVSSSSSSSKATRSFLNSQGEEKVVTNVADCLERMSNADYVVEDGDTAEDQEARALLNKFLGASIIMKGVESSLPATNRQSKIITTTTTSSNLSDDNDGDNNAKHEVKTTRITKTIKSGSSSTPVTYTTCDIEEIWDEEILKELLEQARTYEERRKIRSRLRELMADREETNKSPKGEEKDETSAAVATNVPEVEEESSASEYEEIIEVVTDYSEAESEVDGGKQNDNVVVHEKSQDKEETTETVVTEIEENSATVAEKSEISSAKQAGQIEQVEEIQIVTKTETVEEETKTDSSESEGESLQPMMNNKAQKPLETMPQENVAHGNPSTNSQKLKSAQANSNNNNNNIKATVNDISSMCASYYNSNNKTQKAISTAPLSNQNPILAVQPAGRADSTSISNKHNKISHTNVRNNNESSSGSLSSNFVALGSSGSPRQVDRLGVPQKEDSGTESGEDLRLIAAGLRDQLQIQSDCNIIEDVTCALSRLENSLKEGKDISVDNEKRKALLALVERLRAGLTSPEKLAEIAAAMSELDGNEGLYGETSSPEADAHRSSRSRFGKRKNRVNRHTVGVSREELADARRYMEDMLLMSNISQSATTPEINGMPNNVQPQWYPLEKNASTGAITTQSLTPVLQRPQQCVREENANISYANRVSVKNAKRRPLSGEYSVSFESPTVTEEAPQSVKQGSPSEDSSKASRFTNKKHLMKRANTIDLAKTHKYNPEFDTDSDAEDKGAHLGLKRGVQVSVKKRIQNVVPPFEPKTENDRKFLAFINKQSDKPGLGWTNSRSVSNWTNKFGSIKSTFEGGLTSKPPQPPHHLASNAKSQQTSKLFAQPTANKGGSIQAANYMTNQQIAVRLQREAERQAEDHKKKLQKEYLEYERRERDKFERQRQQHERQERERLEREHFERQRREQDQITAAQHAVILRKQQQLAVAQQTAANMNVPQPIPINEFKHAPQSVFRPIDSVDTPSKHIYKPIPQIPRNSSNWPSSNAISARMQANTLTATSPSHYGNTRPDDSFITSPPPSARSPIVLPWAFKPTVDSSSFKSKAHRFEERSIYDNIKAAPSIHRHNSLNSNNGNNNYMCNDFRKRPSLPNTFDPYCVGAMPLQQDPLAYLPPPQNISFTYSSLKPKTTYQSYPCLPLAVVHNSSAREYQRPRDDSLTDPHSMPLVLTSSNPSYCPHPQALPQPQQPQQQEINQARLARKFDLVSPVDSRHSSPSTYTIPQTDCTDDDLDSDNNMLEYHAVSRVMGKPQSQTAVTVGRRTGHVSDDELYGKNSRAAKNLLTTMKNLGNSNGVTRTKASVSKRAETVTSPKTCLSPDGRSYQAPIVEPLFPEINKFETNRKPLYTDESESQPPALTKPQPASRNQLDMYKSMENLNRTAANRLVDTTQLPQPKPYVSDVQTSYVVSYPVEVTTDDEEFRQKNSSELRRHRNTAENLAGSSSTVSVSHNQNLPSPNTNWTSNPIMLNESSNYQNKPTPYQTSNQNLLPSPAQPTYEAQINQVTTSYASVNPTHNCNPPALDYIKVSAEYEAPAHRHMSSMPIQQQGSMPSATNLPTQATQATPNAKPSYEAASQGEFQQQRLITENSTKHKQTPQQSPERNQRTALAQKPTDYAKQISTKTTTSISKMSDQNSLANKSSREEQRSMRGGAQTVINPKHSNISQEMLLRLDQQRERISNETRRKSLENRQDYQEEQRAHYEAQRTQAYKSSAPPDTPDIVKSSLPKDETQPILKKFGPPQRHHYMPNSYQSPSANATSSTVVTTSTHSTRVQDRSLHSNSNQTVIKKSQQISVTSKPTVIETPATPRPEDDYIPRNIVYNNIHAFSSMTRRQEEESSSTNLEQHHAIRPNKLSKSDSWNQIIMLQNQHLPNNTTKCNQSPTNELRRTKSGHTLALPKMFEAAMTKTDINEKQKTVAAYFSGQKSPTQQEMMVEQLQQTAKRSAINRTKTSQKVSAASRKSMYSNPPIAPSCLQRSATMPHIANLNFLDESNVEDAFEQLIMEQKQQKSSSSTTQKTETKEKDGAIVTTTTKVTTRTVTGSAATPVSPFAKFKQLDSQKSQQPAKSPTTATTSGGGSTASASSANQPIFKFTDPVLNAKAATVKEQLLQWCQSKTQEYENIEITNFSTSWNNGLAFCALIHHFLPDAFDYSQLTPKNRRKNFELAFTVADEKAGIAPLLDVEDMVVMQRPDWKCVFVYVQSIYRRFRNCQ